MSSKDALSEASVKLSIFCNARLGVKKGTSVGYDLSGGGGGGFLWRFLGEYQRNIKAEWKDCSNSMLFIIVTAVLGDEWQESPMSVGFAGPPTPAQWLGPGKGLRCL